MKQRDLPGQTGVHRPSRRLRRSVDAKSHPSGVRGAIGALKPGNAGGAKGSRKMDVE
ncbi:MAG: hypothetical protein LC775_11380 [Acidobacteria bacterium]|nr:hypothetical protein [Acidobacteriota bacterium]